MYTILRTDGTQETINERPTLDGIREAIHCDTLDVVQIGRANGTDEVMLVDDSGALTDKPFNEKATELYHRICKPGTTWQIRGDVAVTRDRYFGRG
jgi:hypothetical protein